MLTAKLEAALQEEISFISRSLAEAEDNQVYMLFSVTEAMKKTEEYIESAGRRNFPAALSNPETMLLVYNHCALQEIDKRERARAAQKIRRESVTVGAIIDALEAENSAHPIPRAEFSRIARIIEHATGYSFALTMGDSGEILLDSFG